MFIVYLERDEFATVNTEEEVEKMITDITSGNMPINVTYTRIIADVIPIEYLWDVIWANDTVRAYPYSLKNRHFYPEPGIVRNDLIFYVRLYAPNATEAIIRSKQIYKESKEKSIKQPLLSQ